MFGPMGWTAAARAGYRPPPLIATIYAGGAPERPQPAPEPEVPDYGGAN